MTVLYDGFHHSVNLHDIFLTFSSFIAVCRLPSISVIAGRSSFVSSANTACGMRQRHIKTTKKVAMTVPAKAVFLIFIYPNRDEPPPKRRSVTLLSPKIIVQVNKSNRLPIGQFQYGHVRCLRAGLSDYLNIRAVCVFFFFTRTGTTTSEKFRPSHCSSPDLCRLAITVAEIQRGFSPSSVSSALKQINFCEFMVSPH